MKKIVFLLIAFFLLTGCGLSKKEKNQMQEDIKQANHIALTYAKEKYNMDAKVVDVYGTEKTFALKTFYDGDIIVKLVSDAKEFYVWVNEKDDILKDTYQNDQVKEDLIVYIESIANGKVMNISINTNKGKNKMDVLKDSINDMFQDTAFMDIKYEKKDLLKYIENIDIYIETVGSDLEKFSVDIQKQGNDQLIDTGLINLNVIDFVNDTAYDRVKGKIDMSTGNSDIWDYGIYIDENITPEYRDNENKLSSQYTSYQKGSIDKIKYSYPSQKTVSIEQIDEKTVYEKIGQEMNDEDSDKLKKLKIDKVYHVKGDNIIVSFAMAFQKEINNDNFFIYTAQTKSDGRISLYNNTLEKPIKYKDKGQSITCICFSTSTISDSYILVGEK